MSRTPHNPIEVPPVAGRRAVTVAIVFTGIAMIVSLTVWLVVMSGRSDANAKISPAADRAARTSMAAMPGMTAAAASNASAPAVAAPITLPENAAALAAARTPFPAALPPTTGSNVRHFTITLKDRVFDIAPGIHFAGWTFDGTAPGPVVHVTQGQMIDIALVNGGAIPHSIDFHAARIAPNAAFTDIAPGATKTFEFKANDPGVFMVHCGTAPAFLHIANGMYFAIVVEPANLPPADVNYVLVSSEWYLNKDGLGAAASLDQVKAQNMTPDWVTWNGYAGQYKAHPLTAKPGQTVRFWVVDAGPSLNTEFHVVGTLLDRAWLNGDLRDAPQHDIQTAVVPAGGSGVFDVKVDEPGIYPFVSHSFASVQLGEVGLLNVGNVPGTMSH
jgi:nitrite reductase (NO-forming)